MAVHDGARMTPVIAGTVTINHAPCWSGTQPGVRRRLRGFVARCVVARGFVGPARWLRSPVSTQHAYNTAKDAPGSYVGVPDDFSQIPMDLLTFERKGVAATYQGDVDHAMAGAGECAQRINDLPKTADMVQQIMAETEEILKGLAAKYVVE